MSKLGRHAYYFALVAGKVGPRNLRSSIHGALGIRADGVITFAANSATQLSRHDGVLRYRYAHAEYRLSRKLTKKSVVYVCRLRANGEYAMSRPCLSCRNAMKARGVTRCYYTISSTEYGVIEF